MGWSRGVVAVALALSLAAGTPGGSATAAPFSAVGDWGSPAPVRDPQLLTLQGALREELGPEARLVPRADGTFLRFAGTSPRALAPSGDESAPSGAGGAGLTLEGARAAGDAFLATYGPLFGLGGAGCTLAPERTRLTEDGRGVTRYQQRYRGVPIVGGEIVVQVEPDGRPLAALADVSLAASVDVHPACDAERASDAALRGVALREVAPPDALRAAEPALWIYDPAVVDSTGPARLVWRLEVRSIARPDLNYLVLVDAQTGAVVLAFNQVPRQAPAYPPYRIVYDAANVPGALPGPEPPARVEDGPASPVAEVNRAYDLAGAVQAFYADLGRNSLDGLGARLVATVRYCESGSACPLANAFWDGAQAAFGDGYATDDVVAHEFTHGVIDSEARFFYYRQSGALSEGFGDAFGEFVDLGTASGPGDDDLTRRWLIGEETPGGTLRNMRDPAAMGDPDRMSSGFWDCDPWLRDNGGIHTNNGVMNRAVYLMTDGERALGISGLGLPKVAHLLYEALTNLLTSGSDYADLALALEQAAVNLGLSEADLLQVRAAVAATEMATPRTAGCPATDAPYCDTGTPTILYREDLENPDSFLARWSPGAHWYYPQNTHPYYGQGWDMTNATSGRYNLWGDADFGNSGLPAGTAPFQPLTGTLTMTQSVLLAANTYLRFNHSYAFEHLNPVDGQFAHGGIVEYSADGGQTWSDAGPLFTHNGYDGILTGSPLAGRMAFAGDSNGYISSRVDLRSLAGERVLLRFTLATDATNGSLGWFIDDIAFYTCPSPPPAPTPRARSVLPLVMKGFAGQGVTTILADDFEGAFPGRWILVDNAPSDAEHTLWGKRSCRAADGVYSSWASGGGSDGAARPCGAEHGYNVHSWLLFGPFSLQGAARAALDVRLWLNAGPGDGLSVMASLDGTTFYGDRLTGSTDGWASHRLDLAAVPGAGSLLGRTGVWIAIAFDSDAAGALPEGAYVDAVHLWKSGGAVVPLAEETAAAAGRGYASTAVTSIMATPVVQSLAR